MKFLTGLGLAVTLFAALATPAFAQNVSPSGKVCKKSTDRAQCYVSCQECDGKNTAAGCTRF